MLRALLVVLLVLAFEGVAAAAGTARLVYLRGQNTESCLDDAALHDAVAARLGYDPFTPFALETLFTEIDKEGTGFVARVKLVGVDGTVRGARTLKTTGACSELTATLALTISLAIDPMALSRGGPPDDLPPSERPVEPTSNEPNDAPPPAPIPDDKPAPPAPAAEHVRFGVGAGAIGAVGAAPGPSLGFVAFGDARLGAFGLTLEGRADLPSGAEADVPGRVSSSLLAATLLPCGHSGGFFACGRGTLGRIAAEGLDVSQPGSSSALWAAIGGRLGGEIPLGGIFRMRVHADADAVLTRYALRIGGEVAFKYPPVAGGLGVALAAVMP